MDTASRQPTTGHNFVMDVYGFSRERSSTTEQSYFDQRGTPGEGCGQRPAAYRPGTCSRLGPTELYALTSVRASRPVRFRGGTRVGVPLLSWIWECRSRAYPSHWEREVQCIRRRTDRCLGSISGSATLQFNFGAGTLAGHFDPQLCTSLGGIGDQISLGRYDFANHGLQFRKHNFSGQLSGPRS